MPVKYFYVIFIITAIAVLATSKAYGEDSSIFAGATSKWELSNGLKVAYVEVKNSPVVTVQLWYRVGSRNDPQNAKGSAKLLESLMFSGSKHLKPRHHKKFIAQCGGSSGSMVTEDSSSFFNSVPRDYLNLVLRLESERMRSLLFIESEVSRAKKELAGTIRELQNQPLPEALRVLLMGIYANTPYGFSVNGVDSHLQNITPAMLRKLYDSYYQPNNALLVIVGDIESEKLRKSVNTHFAKIPRGVLRAAKENPSPKNEGRVIQGSTSTVGFVLFGFPLPKAIHKDIYALQLLSLILGTGGNSRLMREVVRSRKAVQAASEISLRSGPSVLVLYSAFVEKGQMEKVEEALNQQLELLRERPVSEAELKSAKNRLYAAFVFGLQTSLAIGRQSGMSWILSDDPFMYLQDIDKIQALTAAEIQDVARKYLSNKSKYVLRVPLKTQESSTKKGR